MEPLTSLTCIYQSFCHSFRDERYLPFEYAGAISEWELGLPSKIRSFNYNNISDVILHMNYTSLEGDREAGESKIVSALEEYADNYGLFKVISLKYEFSNEFHRILNDGTQIIELDLTKDHFPYFLIDKELRIMEVKVYLKPKRNMSITIPGAMRIDGLTPAWSSSDDIVINVDPSENDKIKGGTVSITGSPIKKWTIEAGLNGIDKETTDDILISVKYKI